MDPQHVLDWIGFERKKERKEKKRKEKKRKEKKKGKSVTHQTEKVEQVKENNK